MKFEEYPIGSIIKKGDLTLEVVENDYPGLEGGCCTGCYFDDNDCVFEDMMCCSADREDARSIVYIEVMEKNDEQNL